MGKSGGRDSDDSDFALSLRDPGSTLVRSRSEGSRPNSRALMDPALELAAASLVVTERARLEIVQNQLIQFCEILSIKFRRRIMMFRAQADQIRDELIRAGDTSVLQGPAQLGSNNTAPTDTAQSFSSTPGVSTGLSGVASFVSLFGPKWTLGLGMVSVASFSYFSSRLVNNLKFALMLMALKQGHDFGSRWQLRSTLSKLDNFLNAFGENGGDELESERIVRNVSKGIGLRHVNQVSRLSKNGQIALSTVIVDRVTQSLIRHPYGYKSESRSWIVNEVQHKVWEAKATIAGFTRPADRVKSREKLSLMERCVRALTKEIVPYDDRPVELEHYLSNGDSSDLERWTAAGLLSKCGICVRHSDDSVELFAHSASEIEKYGFCYGDLEEVKERRMKLQAPLHQSKI